MFTKGIFMFLLVHYVTGTTQQQPTDNYNSDQSVISNPTRGISDLESLDHKKLEVESNSTFKNETFKFRKLNLTFAESSKVDNNITLPSTDDTAKIDLLNVTLDDARGGDISIFEERARNDSFTKTPPEENPYSVLVCMQHGSKKVGICTGSLLTEEWVLTASHCLSQRKIPIDNVVIYAGGYTFKELQDGKPAEGSQTLTSTQLFPHPKWNETADYDIGLIKTNGKFNLTKTVNTVKLSSQPWRYHSYYTCKLTGFGVVQFNVKSDEDETRKTHLLKVKKPCLCSFMLKLVLGSRRADRYICTKPEQDYGPCPGDSGGGLICDGELRAVAMQLLMLRKIDTCQLGFFLTPKCGSRNMLSIFQDSCPFVRWINSHVKLFNETEISSQCDEGVGHSDRIKPSHVYVILIIIMNVYL